MGAFVQQSLDDVDVHLVAVSANCTVAVDIPMTVDEVIHIAVIPLDFVFVVVVHNGILDACPLGQFIPADGMSIQIFV